MSNNNKMAKINNRIIQMCIEVVLTLRNCKGTPQFNSEIFHESVSSFNVDKYIKTLNTCVETTIGGNLEYISKLSFIDHKYNANYVDIILGVASVFVSNHNILALNCIADIGFNGVDNKVYIAEYHEKYNPDMNSSILSRVDRCKQVLQHMTLSSKGYTMDLKNTYSDRYDRRIIDQFVKLNDAYGFILNEGYDERCDVAAIVVTRNLTDIYAFFVRGAKNVVDDSNNPNMSVAAVLADVEFEDIFRKKHIEYANPTLQ